MSDTGTVVALLVGIPVAVLTGAFLYGYLRGRYGKGPAHPSVRSSTPPAPAVESARQPATRPPDKQPFQPLKHSTEAHARVLRVFLSYRRTDSSDIAGRIFDRLAQAFGRENVFKDVDSIPIGIDFRTHLAEAVQQADVLLSVIGHRWLTESDEHGQRRLDSPKDFVRIELLAALERDIPVVPVLVGGAAMPAEGDLPEPLTLLAYRNAVHVRADPDFHTDVDRLIRGLQHHLMRVVARQSPQADRGDA